MYFKLQIFKYKPLLSYSYLEIFQSSKDITFTGLFDYKLHIAVNTEKMKK